MNRILYTVLFLFTGFTAASAQGSWEPPGADLSYPRTLLDSSDILTVRETLENPEILEIYKSVWQNATTAIPPGNNTDGERITRAMMAREAAFVVLMNRKAEGSAIEELLPAERDSLILRCSQLLNEVNTHVGYQDGWVFYQEWQHRSKELIGYLTAYDLLRGAGITAETLNRAADSLVAFTANLYHRAMATYQVFIFPLKFFEFQFNNHSIMTASALGLAAVVFNDHTAADPERWPVNWINAGMWNLDNTLWVQTGLYPRVSEPDTLSGYAEGPGYFDYAFQNSFPFMRAMGNFLPDDDYPFTFGSITRQIRNPWFDDRYDLLYTWINRIRMPDGALPAIHDAPIGFGTTITALSGKPEFNVVNPGFTPDNPLTRTQYIATQVGHGAITDSLFQPLPEAGSLVFRSGWDTAATYWHFIAKHGIILSGAKSHHQGDATSFSLYAHGKLLAIDPGYPGSTESDAVNKPTDHNLILVNGNGPNPPNGEFVSVLTNTAFIENHFDLPSLDYGEIRASYHGATQVRQALFLNGRFCLLADFLKGQPSNNYTFQLHGYGLAGSDPSSQEGSFIPEFPGFSGVWQRDSVRLLATILPEPEGATYTYETDSMAAGSSVYRKYSKMLISSLPGTENTFFLTSLIPAADNQPVVSPVTTIPGCKAIRIADGETNSFILCQLTHDPAQAGPSETGFTQTVSGNGSVNLFSGTPSAPAVLMIREGTTLTYGSQPWVIADHPITFALEQKTASSYSGYTSDSGQVKIYSNQPLRATSGAITAIDYDAATHLNTLTFQSGGQFTLEATDGMDEDQTGTVPLKVWPNPSSDGRFHIAAGSLITGTVNLEVTDAAGRTVINRDAWIVPATSSIEIDLSGLPAGSYNLSVKGGNGSGCATLIKK
jgi:hypothetical protein